MASYFKFFVFGIFPIPLTLMGLLLFPFPRKVHKQVIRLTDMVLFYNPHPNIQVSLFWICFGISVATMVLSYQSYDDKKTTYYMVKSNGGLTETALAKLLGAERNIWIATTGTALWLLLHRYRSLLKQLIKAEDALSSTKKVS